jgi:hypothetical protein
MLILKSVKKFNGYIKYRNAAPEVPIHPWDYPDKPWQRIYVDFAGPFWGSMFLIIIDTLSK